MSDYNPSEVGKKGSLFGFPYNEEEADLIIIPVPWEVTTSSKPGTAQGPQAIMEASIQLDFSITGILEPWKYKAVMLPVDDRWVYKNEEVRKQAFHIIQALEDGEGYDADLLQHVNRHCYEMVLYGRKIASQYLNEGKKVAFLGGDHSVPLGLIKELASRESFGILQIDAHMDLRDAYEGFIYSHASIMSNALQSAGVESLTQVGVRDYCEEEELYIDQSRKSVFTFFDDTIKAGLFRGKTWGEWVDEIIATLPQKVYISFDIDGLQPGLCPNTGTPVPGGITFEEADFLIRQLVLSGREIIGFDLCEVAPGSNDWDASVGARILYRLSSYLGISEGKLEMGGLSLAK